jgi:hypothetical protein
MGKNQEFIASRGDELLYVIIGKDITDVVKGYLSWNIFPLERLENPKEKVIQKRENLHVEKSPDKYSQFSTVLLL